MFPAMAMSSSNVIQTLFVSHPLPASHVSSHSYMQSQHYDSFKARKIKTTKGKKMQAHVLRPEDSLVWSLSLA